MYFFSWNKLSCPGLIEAAASERLSIMAMQPILCTKAADVVVVLALLFYVKLFRSNPCATAAKQCSSAILR